MDNQEEETQEEEDQQDQERGSQDNSVVGKINNLNRTFNQFKNARGTGRLAGSGAKTGVRIAATAARGVATVGVRAVGFLATIGPVGWVVIIIVILMLFVILSSSGGGPSLDTGGGSNSGGGGGSTTSPGGGSLPGTSEDITYCSFYRGSELPSARQYKSPTLIKYFEEAAVLSGVPAAVLAAVARVETPSLTSLTDDTLSSYSCPVSPDGAMGPMQIVVHYSSRTDAICRDCIDVGAKFLGKTVDELTQSDYCDLKTGIVIGAGFILKKMQYNYSLSAVSWEPSWTTSQDAMYKLANSFYGCLGYPSCSLGPYNYGDDLWNSVQYCKPTGPGTLASASCPIANGMVTCGSKNNAINGCGHCDASYIARYDPENRSCSFPNTQYAMDIGGNDFQEVYLPTINGHQIKWDFIPEGEESRGANESLFGYAGEDTQNGDRFYLQLIHVQPGSQAAGSVYSGTIGARICGNGCRNGRNARHVHVELGTGGTSLGNVTWADATQFFCGPSV